MRDLDIILELCNYKKKQLVLEILKDIFQLANKVKIYCKNETFIYSSRDKEYDLSIKLILYVYIFENKTISDCYCIEFFLDNEKICYLNFENQLFKVSERYYKKCLNIVVSNLSNIKLYKNLIKILTSISNINKEAVLDSIEKFKKFMLENIETKRLPDANDSLSYKNYRLIMFDYYPEEIKKSFLEVETQYFDEENYINIAYCNTIIKFIISHLIGFTSINIKEVGE